MRIPSLRAIAFMAVVVGAFGFMMYSSTRSQVIAKSVLTVVGQTAVPVHCRASLADAVAVGHYGEVNQYVEENHFPSYHVACKESEEAMYFIGFDKSMRRDEVIAQLNAAGFRPADLRELLAFGELHSASYHNSTVVALGSQMSGMDLFPYLYSDQSAQNIGLHGDGECEILGCNELFSFGYQWHAGDLFLAVRK